MTFLSPWRAADLPSTAEGTLAVTSGLRPPQPFTLQEWPCPHGSNADYDFQPQNTLGHFSSLCFLKESARNVCRFGRSIRKDGGEVRSERHSYALQGRIGAPACMREVAARRPCWTRL